MVAGAVEAEPAPEVTAGSAVANVGSDTGGPPPELGLTHSIPLAGLSACIVAPSRRAASGGSG